MKSEEIKNARELAENELRDEMNEEAVDRIKELLLQIQNSKKVTANLERELDELELELSHNDVS